jgi:hypothetical protein
MLLGFVDKERAERDLRSCEVDGFERPDMLGAVGMVI